MQWHGPGSIVLPAGVKAGGTVLPLNGGAPAVFNGKANVGVAVVAGRNLSKGEIGMLHMLA